MEQIVFEFTVILNKYKEEDYAKYQVIGNKL